MTIANKLALLEQTKEAQRVKLGLPESMPFSQYIKFMQAWTPADLFANGEQGVWLDSSDLSTMFQDVDGLEPVTKDGDPVALIKDKSGNGNHAIQETASARPIYRTDGNLHWLEFDGVDDTMIVSGLSLNTDDYLFAVAMKYHELNFAGHSFTTIDGNNILEVYHGGKASEYGRIAIVTRFPITATVYDSRQAYHPINTSFTYRLGKKEEDETGFLEVSGKPSATIEDMGIDYSNTQLRIAQGAEDILSSLTLYNIFYVNSSHTDSADKIDAYLANKAGITL